MVIYVKYENWGLYKYPFWHVQYDYEMNTTLTYVQTLMLEWFLYPTSSSHRLCVLKNSHDHAKLMGRPNKKVTTGITEDDPPTVEDQSLEKDGPQGPSSSKASEAEEQRLKELEEQVLRK